MGPSEVYEQAQGNPSDAENEGRPTTVQSNFQLQEWKVQEIFNEVLEDLPNCTQYYVDIDGDEVKDIIQGRGTRSFNVDHDQVVQRHGNSELVETKEDDIIARWKC